MKIKTWFGIIFLSLILLTSCKAKKNVVTNTPIVPTTKAIEAKQITDKYYKQILDFKTLYIKADVDYKDAKQAQSVSAEIKIQKDKTILVSVRFLGITVAKALITPKKVEYYEKIGSKYFEGDYTTISKWLGTDLDFQKIQNMILGQPLEDLSKNKYEVKIDAENYVLFFEKNESKKQFTFNNQNYTLLNQEIAQPQNNRKVKITHTNHKNYLQGELPMLTNIEAMQDDLNTNILIDYNKAVFNDELTFPYSVPRGYEKIELK
jgi:hypothetical protein